MGNTEQIIKLILDELRKVEAKHPSWPVDIIHADAIINEEKGELTRACLQWNYEEGSQQEIADEAVQTAAMCIRFLKHSYQQNKTTA